MSCAALWVAATLLVQAPPDVGPPGEIRSSTVAPRIDVISIGPADPMYAIFGHSALRVVHEDGRDLAYNFGGVDLTQEAFWTRVVQGRLETFLNVTSYADLLLDYSAQDRTIVGRTLRLTPAQARALVERAEAMRRGEARVYRYHQFDDNCTTKIAALLDETLEGRLSAGAAAPAPTTHRRFILDRLHRRWALFVGMDLVGNGYGDGPITRWDMTYIPDGFDWVLDRAEVDGRPLVARRYIDYRTLSNDHPEIWDWPWTKVYLLIGLPLLGLAFWRPRPVAVVWGVGAGLVGLVYVMLWLVSDYAFYRGNWNLLVLPPTHLWLAWLALSRARWASAVPRALLAAHAVILGGLALARAGGVIGQDIDPMLGLALPVAVALLYARSKAPPSSALAPG